MKPAGMLAPGVQATAIEISLARAGVGVNGRAWSDLERAGARISARELQGHNSKGVRISLTEMLKRWPANGITLKNGKTGQIRGDRRKRTVARAGARRNQGLMLLPR